MLESNPAAPAEGPYVPQWDGCVWMVVGPTESAGQFLHNHALARCEELNAAHAEGSAAQLRDLLPVLRATRNWMQGIRPMRDSETYRELNRLITDAEAT